MKLTDLQFEYPEELVATQPHHPSRIMWVSLSEAEPKEISYADLLGKIPSGDVLVVNNTKVLKRRVFSGDVEILFLKQFSSTDWEVLFPSKRYKIGDKLALPEGISMELIEKGRPQKVRLSQAVGEDYFQLVAELPLPPYIQKARHDRHTVAEDDSWYQTAWASKPGSFAAPTASLHFSSSDISDLRIRGVKILEVTLHVGLGTFLPVTAADLNDHEMHEEYAEISAGTWAEIQTAKAQGARIWSLGSTSVRTLESAAKGLLKPDGQGGFSGFTQLLIQPGFEWKVVDVLMTNFHQPESTLLAMVAGFSSLQKVKTCYQWAIERKFRLFSYGDLSVWIN